jgi:DNA polymerase-3 subunit delta
VPTKNFTFICGSDDFVVGRLGKERYAALAADTADDYSREIIDGFAANVGEVATAIARFRESVQTIPLFGGKRVVWLKDVNFLADTVTGRAESTLEEVGSLQELLAGLNPAEVDVLITAAPIDRRRAFPKWCEKNADFVLADSGADGGADALAGIVLGEAKRVDATFEPDAIAVLLAKVGANSRLLVEEVRKLATHAGDRSISVDDVDDLVANVAEGDFFEAAEMFFTGHLPRTLDALHRHFFTGGDARPIIAALQNRNRILLQVRAAMDTGDMRVGPRGLDGLPKAAAAYKEKFGEAAGEKSSYNLFTQNPWYLGKLTGSAKLPSLRRLIDNQREFIVAFGDIVKRPNEQEEVLRDMAVRCLS